MRHPRYHVLDRGLHSFGSDRSVVKMQVHSKELYHINGGRDLHGIAVWSMVRYGYPHLVIKIDARTMRKDLNYD